MAVDADEARRIDSQREQQGEQAARCLQVETDSTQLTFEQAPCAVVGDLLGHVEGFHLIEAVGVGYLTNDVDVLRDVLGESLVRNGHEEDLFIVFVAKIQNEALLCHAHIERSRALHEGLCLGEELTDVRVPLDVLGFGATL